MGQDNVADAGPSVGDLGMDDTSDRSGTGEHLTAGKEPRVRVNAGRDDDRVVGPVEAGRERLVDEAAEVAVEDAVPLRRNTYKIPLVRALVRRALQALAFQAGAGGTASRGYTR